MAAATEPRRTWQGGHLSQPAPRRIALLGAESTGKTSLAAALADRLGGVVVEEYLREFCQVAGRVPGVEEQAGIAAEQARRERLATAAAAARGQEWVVCDTSPLMIALYSIDCFGDDSLLAGAIDWQRSYAATLVCLPDIDWVADGIQRIGPETRQRIHHQLLGLLDAHGIRWKPVAGSGAQRLESALAALTKFD